jgi:fructose-1,6-bisphosphatase I/sedoheptulose-1,7-bisphosphatase
MEPVPDNNKQNGDLRMPLSRRPTLTRHLIEQRRRFPEAGGGLNALLLDVALACKAIAGIVACGAPVDPSATGAGPEVRAGLHGETPQPLAAKCAEVFIRMHECNGHLAGMVAAAMDAPRQIAGAYPRGHYLLLFDPLDGEVNLDVNVPVGSMFSILRAPQDVVDSGRDVLLADFLQPGLAQVAAGFALYGPTTTLMLTMGNGVAGFTLNPALGEFVLTHPDVQVPADTQDFAIDSINSRFWEQPVKRYVDECLAGKIGPRGKDFNMRSIASMVAEAHRILLRGGIFMHPRDNRMPGRPCRRLLHEANPIGFILEQAGGRASTGRQPVLAVAPMTLHQRIGLVFGSRNEVERIERYYREPASRDQAAPLFVERSLFRD